MKHAKWQFFGIRASIFALVVGLFMVISCSHPSVWSPNQVIQWNYNGKATAEGTGCNTVDTTLLPTRNQISILFTNFRVEVVKEDGEKVDKKTCRIIIPVKIKADYYIADMKQDLYYGYSGFEPCTGGEVVLESLFLGKTAGKSRGNIPVPGYEPWDWDGTIEDWYPEYIETTVDSTFGPDSCSQSNITAVYEAELTLGGFRENLNKSIAIQIDGLGIVVHGASCITD